LNHYVNVVCSSDIKSTHWYAYFVSVGIIVLFFVYGLLLKGRLEHIKQSYFLLHRKPHKDFENLIIKERDIVRNDLQQQIINELKWYLFYKICVTTVIIIATAALLTLKYSIKAARNLFLPFENHCGPVLV